ncbi:putative RNA-directed DNA polymerase [Tanacetum coccineum]
MLRRSTRQKVMPAKFNDFFVNISSLRKFHEASQNPKWIEAMNLEMEALFRNNTYVLADLPPRRKAIRCKWIWKIKYKSSSEIDRYKARLMAKGSGQRKGIVYKETFSPVVKMVTVRCLTTLSVQNSWPLFQLDVNNAFLYSDLKEEVYMELPPGYYDKNETKNGIFIAILVYVDYIVVIENNENEIDKFKKFLSSKFMIKDLAATLLQQKVMLSYKKSKSDKFLPNMTEYQNIVGKLIYLSITRLDISYVVQYLSQHMHAPLQSHFTVALRVLRYLKNASGTGVQFYKVLYLGKVRSKQTITRSSAESEHRCLASTTCEIIWVIKVLKDSGMDGLLPAHLYCDSSYAISVAENPVFHEKTKHFEIDLHLVREKVSDGVVKVLKVASASNVVDIFTKGLGIAQHNEFCKKIRFVNMFKP